MNHWLLKSEPDAFSFTDLKNRPGRREPWSGVRNYTARNFMRDQMKEGDLGLFYHSSCPEPGVAGILKVASKPYPDETQFDPKSDYYDEKSSPTNPRWMLVDVAWHQDLPRLVSLEEMRADAALKSMMTLQRGNRLSITPVTKAEFQRILALAKAK